MPVILTNSLLVKLLLLMLTDLLFHDLRIESDEMTLFWLFILVKIIRPWC
jgi:hypothetical protein